MPNPYAILAALGVSIALIIGAFFYGEHVSSLSWKAATAKLEASAAQKLSDANAAAAKKDADNAEIARELETAREQASADLDSTRADFSKQLADRVRVASSRACGSSKLPSGPVDTAKPQEPATGGDARLPSIDAEGLGLIADNAMKLEADLTECVNWANRVGK